MSVRISDDGWQGQVWMTSAEICLFSWVWALKGGPSLGAGQMLQGMVTGPRRDPLLLTRAWTLEGESQALGSCPFLSEQNSILFGGGL